MIAVGFLPEFSEYQNSTFNGHRCLIHSGTYNQPTIMAPTELEMSTYIPVKKLDMVTDQQLNSRKTQADTKTSKMDVV